MQYFRIKDIYYSIKSSEVFIKKKADTYCVMFRVCGVTDNISVSRELREAYVYLDKYIDTGMKSIAELEGYIMRPSRPNAGTLCVLEHEYIRNSKITIVDVNDDKITIHWKGHADIFWDEKYGENVPFDMEFVTKYVS